MSRSATGYFQRLAQRSGLTGEQQAAPKTNGAPVNASAPELPIEVDDLRQVAQPITTIKPSAQRETGNSKNIEPTFIETAPEVSASGYSDVAMADTDTVFEQPLTDKVASSVQTMDSAEIDPLEPKIETVKLRQPTILSTDETNEFVQPVTDALPGSETHRQDAPIAEQGIEQFSTRELSAAVLPRFIREQLQEKVREAAPENISEHILEEHVTEQIVDQSAAVSDVQTQEVNRPVMQVEVTARQEQAEHTKTHEDSAAHISIGQISIDVHTPAPVTSLQVSAKPHRAQRPSRPHQPARPTNLHRYYLRGM